VSNVLQFHEVVRAYQPGVPVLNGVTFAAAEGEVVGLLGRNGAGKTTLIRIALGMLHPQSGEVRVFGVHPLDDPVAVKKRIGYVAEEQMLPRRSSVAELIAFHRYLFPSWDERMARDLLDRFQLPERARIGRLSKGEARQVALLCAVCHRPELLLLDEPASGLDPAARREFLEVSIQLLNREGSTILFSSHYMNDVERIGERIVLLDEGKVRIDAAMDRLREDFCLALAPDVAVESAALLENVPGCMRARLVGDEWHAVFQGDAADVQKRLSASLGRNSLRCVRLPLEELFVELLGGCQAWERP